ncbi:MAG: histidine kinase [Bacteroidetes bacterium]|nr:histidine kinase [Bacteroidota bacterium]
MFSFSILSGLSFITSYNLPRPETEEFEMERTPFITVHTRSNGLPVGEVNKLFRDKSGILWLMCPEGLVRYDGMGYRLFKYEPGDSSSLLDNWVEGLTETPDRRIWIATGKGINIIHPGNSAIQTFSLPDTFKKDINHTAITCIYYDAFTKSMFFGFNKGVGQVSTDGKFIGYYDVFGADRGYHKVTSIFRDSTQRLWISALHFGVMQLNEKERKIKHIPTIDNISGKPIFVQAVSVSEPIRGMHYINTWGQGILKVVRLKQDTMYVKSLIWDKNPGLENWSNIATGTFMKADSGSQLVYFSSMDGGFGTLNLHTDEIEFIKYQNNLVTGNQQIFCSDILYANGSIWIATNIGMLQYCPDNQFLEKFKFPQDNRSFWGVNAKYIVTDIIAQPGHKGQYWMLSEKGVIAHWNQNKHKIKYFYRPFLNKPDYFLAARNIHILTGHFLLITDRGNFVVDSSTMEVKENHPFTFFKTHSVSVIETIDNEHWLITTPNQGIYIYAHRTNQSRKLYQDNGELGWLRHSTFFRENLLITGTTGSLLLIDTASGKKTTSGTISIRHSKDTLNGLYRAAIQNNAECWLSSPYGLFHYSAPDTQVTSWPNPVYGKNHWITDVVKDFHGNIWYTGRSFLGFVNHKKSMQYTFDHSNGLDEIPVHKLVLNGDSSLFVLARHTLYFKPPYSIQPEVTKPVLKLESITMEGKQVQETIDNKIQVPASVKSLELAFINLRFGSATQFRYHIIVKSSLGDSLYFNTNKISFPFLKPGIYKIYAAVIDKNNAWNHAKLFFELNVLRPWYLSYLAYALYLVISVGIVALIVSILMIRKDKVYAEKRKIEKTISDLEMSTLRAQINPHFIFNSLNSIQNYILSNKALDASEYLAKFSRLIRLILESSMENLISLEQEKELLIYYLELEKLRTNNKFSFTIFVDPAINPKVKIPSMLAQPYLENSIWHGFDGIKHPGIIDIQFLLQQGYCLCIIRDNGKGLTAASQQIHTPHKHKSRGTAITRQRLQIMSSDIDKAVELREVKDLKGRVSGTEVRIKIPIHEN